MQFARSVTANFKQLIYAAVYSFMPIPWAEQGYIAAARFVPLFHSSFLPSFLPSSSTAPFFEAPLGKEGVRCQPFCTRSRTVLVAALPEKKNPL